MKYLRIAAVCCLLAGFAPARGEANGEAYKWSVQYLIDQSQKVLGHSQQVFPRRNRGIALTPDGRYLYATYHHSTSQRGEVRKIDLAKADYTDATLHILPDVTAKAVAVDEKGRVYLSCENEVKIYDANLRTQLGVIDTDTCEGIVATKEGGDVVIYYSERREGTLHRCVIKEDGGRVTAEEKGFGSDGTVTVNGAKSLRGVAIDADGRVVVADEEANKVFRFDSSGKEAGSADVKGATAVGCDRKRYFVTEGMERQIAILDDEMKPAGTLSVPWEQLELSPPGNNRNGRLSAIVVIPEKGFLVANEGGQTASQRSTYGRQDDSSDIIEGKLYMDAFADDNEPILRAVPASASSASK